MSGSQANVASDIGRVDRVAVFRRTLAHLLGPVQALLDDAEVSEILINRYDLIYVERRGRLQRAPAAFASPDALLAALRNIAQYVGKRLEVSQPSIEARLPDGTRVHIVHGPAARDGGLCASFRKFPAQHLSIDQLVRSGSLSASALDYLRSAVEQRRNIIVAGGTASGKTTLLNCLSSLIPPGERIIVLEDASELRLQQEHVVYFEAQPPDRHGRGGLGIRDLLRASLRMRPDRIVVGECRGGEALDMIQAMTSGHDGSMSTCHASNPRDALNRLETLALMSGIEIPLHALRTQLAAAVDVIVQINRQRDGSRRVTQIAEVDDALDGGAIVVRDVQAFAAPALS